MKCCDVPGDVGKPEVLQARLPCHHAHDSRTSTWLYRSCAALIGFSNTLNSDVIEIKDKKMLCWVNFILVWFGQFGQVFSLFDLVNPDKQSQKNIIFCLVFSQYKGLSVCLCVCMSLHTK